MPTVENISPEAAYATKSNIVLPERLPTGQAAAIALKGLDDIGRDEGLPSLGTLLQAAKTASDASDAAVQADGGAAGGTKTASTASKAAVDAVYALLTGVTKTSASA
jgi:hypothetical protein